MDLKKPEFGVKNLVAIWRVPYDTLSVYKKKKDMYQMYVVNRYNHLILVWLLSRMKVEPIV